MQRPAACAAIAPLQARSRETLGRILDAAERILARKEFEDMSIAEVAEGAGVSVGNFYARFRDKDALLEVLHERYESERLALLTAAFAEADRPGATLASRAHAVTRAVVELFRARRGVLRSLVLRHWRSPDTATTRTKQGVDKVLSHAHAVLLGARKEIKHADAETAVRVAFAAILASCREAIVLRPLSLPGALALSDKDLTRELAHMLHAYLTHAQRRGTQP
jgi:AcrR family transcriptional regulator